MKKGLIVVLASILSSGALFGCSKEDPINKEPTPETHVEKVYTLSATQKVTKLFESFTLELKDDEQNTVMPTWESTDQSICSVSSSGIVTSKRIGSTKINATYDSKTYSCDVTVVDPDVVPYLKFENSKKSILVNEVASETIRYFYNSQSISVQSLTFDVENPEILDVENTSTGCKITGKKSGSTVITVKSDWYGLELFDSIDVTVSDDVEVNLSSYKETLYLVSDTEHSNNVTVSVLSVVKNANNIVNPTIVWTTDDEEVATVSDSGVITANGIGATIITATWNDDGIEYSSYVGITVAYIETIIEEKISLSLSEDCILDLSEKYGTDLGNLIIVDETSMKNISFLRNGNVYTLNKEDITTGVGLKYSLCYECGIKLSLTLDIADLLIRNISDLLTFRENVNKYNLVKLENDIDLGSTVIGTEDGAVDACKSFNGVFEGNSHKIKNGIYETGGLFQDIGKDAVVKDIAFEGAVLNSRHAQSQVRSWTVFANNISGTVRNVLIDVTVDIHLYTSGNGGNYGTALCYMVEDSANIANIIVYWKVRDIYNAAGTKTKSNVGSYSNFSVTGRLAKISLNSTLTNIYSFNKANGSGTMDFATDTDSRDRMTVLPYETTCAEAELSTKGFDDVWNFNSDKARMGVMNLEISTVDDFIKFRNSISSYELVTLKNDIDLGSTVIGTKVKDGTVEECIGTFTGTFDGQGHAIKGGYYGTYGLFGDIGLTGVVQNLEISGCELEGVQSIQTAIIAGRIKGTVKNVLIDTNYQALLNSSNAGGASGTAICHNLESTATLENIIVYWNVLPRKKWSSGVSDIHYTAAKTITGVGTASAAATVKNIYSFSLYNESTGDQATKDANTELKAIMNVLLYSATCEEAGLTIAEGFDSSVWDFTSTKAALK